MDEYGIELAFLYPTSMGNVSRVREPDYAVALCEAYNDYVYDHYVKVSERLKPIAIIPPQDPERAAIELRRAVKQLGYRAAVIRTTGLRLPLGHRFYDPIYREAETWIRHRRTRYQRRRRACFGRFRDVHRSSHGILPGRNLRSVLQHDFSGSPKRFPKLRLAFLEIGCTWLPYWLDRMDEHWEKRGQNRNAASDAASQRLRSPKADFFQLGVRRGSTAGNFPLRRRRPLLIRHRHSALGQRVPGKSTEDTKTAGPHRGDQEQALVSKRRGALRDLARIVRVPMRDPDTRSASKTLS